MNEQPKNPVEQPAAATKWLDWAVERWEAEVKNRPLVNVHRRALDDTWRQVIRHCGGDDVSLLGPRHDDLLAANPIKAADRAASHAVDANDLDFTPDARHAIADMANIGFALLEQIARMAPGYNWNDSPVEIVSDLINERDEARAAPAPSPADERAAFEEKFGTYGYDLTRTSEGYVDIRTSCAWRGWYARAASASQSADERAALPDDLLLELYALARTQAHERGFIYSARFWIAEFIKNHHAKG